MKQAFRRLSLVLTVVFMVGLLATAFAGCKDMPNENDLLKLEAELAIVEPSTGNSNRYLASANSKSENITSNAKFVQRLTEVGNKVTWFFNATAEAETELYLVVANGTRNAGGFTAGGGAAFTMTLNGAPLNVPSTAIRAASEYLDDWQSIKIAPVTLKAGENRIVLEVKDTTGSVNIDYLAINKKMAEVSTFTFDWKDETTSATCEQEGTIYKVDQVSGYRYLFSTQAALGHAFGDARFDATYNGGEGGMVTICKNCGDTVYVGAVPDEVFGEVFDTEEDFIEDVRAVKTVFEGEDAATGLPNGYDGAKGTATHISTGNNSSGNKFIANTSGNDNYVKFDIVSSVEAATDIAFRMANTRNTSSEILPMDPMSDYVEFKMYNQVVGEFQDEVALYNTGTPNRNDDPAKVVDVGVNAEARAANKEAGASVNFDFTVFPGISPRNFYHWRYVVVKNIYISEGLNSFVFRPVEGQKAIPNIDVLNFYTDEDIITPYYFCDIDDVEVAPGYSSATNTVKVAFTEVVEPTEEPTEESGEPEVDLTTEYSFKSGQQLGGDLVLTLTATENITSLASYLTLHYNSKSIQLIPVALASGKQALIVPNVGLGAGNNVFAVEFRNAEAKELLAIDEVAVYTTQVPADAISAQRSTELNAQYDYFLYGDQDPASQTPAFIFEAEADGVNSGGTVYDRTTNADVSGDKSIGNLSGAGRKLVFKFTVTGGSADAVIAIRAACSNYTGGANQPMIDLSQFVTLLVDGIAVDLSGVDLPDNTSYYKFEMIVLESLNLAEGEHVVEFISKGNCPNVDVMYVFSDGALTFAPVLPVTEPST